MTAESFKDRHCHPLFAGRESRAIKVTDCSTKAEVVQVLTEHLIEKPGLTWIDAASFDLDLSAAPSASDLDEVSGDIPITVHTKDHHTLWVNTAALKLAHLDERVPALESGSVQLDLNGQPSGLLFEWEAMRLVLDLMPSPSLEHDIESLQHADDVLKAAGITSATDAWIDSGMAEVYFAADARGLLDVSYQLNVRVSADAIDAQFAYLREVLLLARAHQTSNSKVAIAGIKIFLDGVTSTKTAALLGEYRDGSNGQLIWTNLELENVLKRLANISSNLRPHFHAIGDAAVKQALDAVTFARENNLWTGSQKPVIAHAELIADSDLRRFAELDVEVVISPQWLETTPHRRALAQILNDADFDRLDNFVGLLRHGATVSYGSDWPVSEPNPAFAHQIALEYLKMHGQSGERLDKSLFAKLKAVFY